MVDNKLSPMFVRIPLKNPFPKLLQFYFLKIRNQFRSDISYVTLCLKEGVFVADLSNLFFISYFLIQRFGEKQKE